MVAAPAVVQPTPPVGRNLPRTATEPVEVNVAETALTPPAAERDAPPAYDRTMGKAGAA
jgi:hypothetical protein